MSTHTDDGSPALAVMVGLALASPFWGALIALCCYLKFG